MNFFISQLNILTAFCSMPDISVSSVTPEGEKKDRKIKRSIADDNEVIFNPLFWASPLFSCCCNVSSVQRMCSTWCKSTFRLYLFAFYLMLSRKTFTMFLVCFPFFELDFAWGEFQYVFCLPSVFLFIFH